MNVVKPQNVIVGVLCCFAASFNMSVRADNDPSSIKDLDLESLLNQRVALHRESDTASGVSESIMDAPAAMVVISKEDIKRRGYTSIDDIMSDLPGFDVITTHGTENIVAYQRGYRTPFTQRTLLLINGKVDNNMWVHSAIFSKQYPMQSIERIEVLYGPAGAVYGPNAFLGVINIITKDPRHLKDGEDYFSSQFVAGSYESYGVDLTSGGNLGGLSYVVSAKFYESESPDIEDYSEWGYFKESYLSDIDIWGEAIANSDFNNDGITDTFNGNTLGEYGNPKSDVGIIAEAGYGKWKAGIIYWETDEAYGPYYAFDKAQPNVSWLHDSTQYYIEHGGKIENIGINTELLYRENNVYGYWVESSGGWVSLSNWNAFNTAWRFRQQYTFQVSDNLQLSGGIKYESKDLTKAYTICGYWGGSVCPAEGGYSNGSSIRVGDDRVTVSLPAQITRDELVPHSMINTTDKGAYLQGIYNIGKWRFNGGLRWDNNSIYGTVVNPRGAAIYHHSADTTFKLIYGEAFQEPSPKDLYGGWSGRAANPNLQPETMSNLEFIAIHQTKNFLHDASLYYTQFEDVIVNGPSGNIGERTVTGFEYRGQVNINNPVYSGEDITGKIYYTYTKSEAEFQYIQGYNSDGSDAWVDNSDDLGDMAPHKINLIFDFPITSKWGLNFQLNYVSDRELYSENPLRAEYNNNRVASENREASAYMTVDLNLRYHRDSFEVGFKINNLFGEEYYHPGVESAGSGDNFSQPSAGFNNSLIPQVNEANFVGYFSMHF